MACRCNEPCDGNKCNGECNALNNCGRRRHNRRDPVATTATRAAMSVTAVTEKD
jgi:hypothetical protein